MADAKDEDVIPVDETPVAEAPKAEEPVAEETKATEPEEPVVVVEEPKPPVEPALVFPEGTTAKDLAMELFTLHGIQRGVGQSTTADHLIGMTKVAALKRYEQICDVLAKILIE